MEAVRHKSESTKKITRKQLQEIKKLEKAKKKQQTEEIIEKHVKSCMKILDDAYSEVMQNLDNANNELLSMSNFLAQEKLNMQKAVKEGNLDLVEEMAEESAATIEKFIHDFADVIVPRKVNSVASPLVKAGQEATDYLNNLKDRLELDGFKNAFYIAQIVMNKIKAKASEYADMTCNDFYFENPYMEMFGEALEEYTQYIESLKLDEDYEIEEVEINDKKIKKIISNSRLRCTHSDMMNFAKAMGYEENRQTNTTHRIWKNKETGISLPIPAKGNRTLPQGTMSRILRQMNLTRADLAEFLNK